MCGIVAYNGIYKASWYIQESLKHLEYRGYDSYGCALLNDNKVFIHKDTGFVKQNYASYLNKFIESSCGIGHVRWATNGVANKANAHPHKGGENITLVHNGIIQNCNYLKKRTKKYKLKGDTDTEVLAHYLDSNLHNLEKALKEVEGDYAILFLVKGSHSIFAACNNIPLYLAHTKQGNLLASSTNVFDEVLINYEFIRLEDNKLLKIDKKKKRLNWQSRKNSNLNNKNKIEKSNGYITLREIKKQQEVIKNFKPKKLNLDKKKKVILFGCGSSYNAANISKYFFRDAGFENIEVYIPNELRYLNLNGQYIAISQSGETKDVLDIARSLNNFTAIVNSKNTTLEKLATRTLHLECEPEIGVAATKTVTATMLMLLGITGSCLRLDISALFNKYYPKMPNWLENIEKCFLFGNGIAYYCNLEGALKLKEMACIHAEAVYASEVKHGPIALINEKMLSIFVLIEEKFQKYILDNISQVKSRGGKILVIAPKHLYNDTDLLEIPSESNAFTLIVYLQLLAWELGRLKGTNIDKPVNLAKCVTV